MERLKSFHDRYVVLKPPVGSFSSEGQSTRWSSKELDPVRKEEKRWEWYHVGGFWIAEGFTAVTMQSPSASMTLGLSPGLTLAAYFIGTLLITAACCGSGYIGSKVSGISQSHFMLHFSVFRPNSWLLPAMANRLTVLH